MKQQQKEVNLPATISTEPLNIDIRFHTSVLLMHIDRFSQLIGLSKDVVRGWVVQGYIPTVKLGRYNMINLAKLSQECLGEIS